MLLNVETVLPADYFRRNHTMFHKLTYKMIIITKKYDGRDRLYNLMMAVVTMLAEKMKYAVMKRQHGVYTGTRNKYDYNNLVYKDGYLVEPFTLKFKKAITHELLMCGEVYEFELETDKATNLDVVKMEILLRRQLVYYTHVWRYYQTHPYHNNLEHNVVFVKHLGEILGMASSMFNINLAEHVNPDNYDSDSSSSSDDDDDHRDKPSKMCYISESSDESDATTIL